MMGAFSVDTNESVCVYKLYIHVPVARDPEWLAAGKKVAAFFLCYKIENNEKHGFPVLIKHQE